MGDFGMELNAIQPARGILHGGDGCIVSASDALEPGRQLLDPVTVAHPHRDLAGRQTLEKWTTCIDQELGMAILSLSRRGHPTAELMGHQLHTIAYAEDRSLYLKELSADRRGFWLVNAGRPPRKDNAARIEAAQRRLRQVIWVNLAVDMALPDAPCNELGILRTKIEDDDHI